jgi:hypothetical protein
MLAIPQSLDPLLLRAMVAAVELTLVLKPVPDDADAAMLAHRSQRMDCAFEAVISVGLTAGRDLKCLVVVVPAGFALSQDRSPDWLR